MPWCATPRRVEPISNVCRHRQAVMLKGSGSLQRSKKRQRGRQHCVPPAPLQPTALGGRIVGRAALLRTTLPEPEQLRKLRGVERPAV